MKIKLILFSISIVVFACIQSNAHKKAESANSPVAISDSEKEKNRTVVDGLSDHWYEVKYKEDENIIFVPCDYQNNEFIFKKVGNKTVLETIEGQDGFEYDVLSVTKLNESTRRVKVFRKGDNIKFSYYVQKIDEHNAIWTKGETYDCRDCDWSNQDLDSLDLKQISIRMVSEEGKSNYKVVKAPPCLD